jgi:hypothetical protein
MITTTTVTMAAAYVGDQLTGLAYPSGNCPWCVGAVLGGGLNMAMQLFQYNGDWSCVDWGHIGADTMIGAAANSANRAFRQEQGFVNQPVDIHEIQPIKFGGNPTDSANKIVLPRNFHRQQVTPWWNQLLRDLGG